MRSALAIAAVLASVVLNNGTRDVSSVGHDGPPGKALCNPSQPFDCASIRTAQLLRSHAAPNTWISAVVLERARAGFCGHSLESWFSPSGVLACRTLQSQFVRLQI